MTLSNHPARTLVSRRALLAGAAGLAAAAGTGVLTAAPASAALVGPRTNLRYLRNVFAGDPSAAGTARWQYQVLQSDRRRPAAGVVGEQVFYATAVRRTSDEGGVTQCMLPSTVPSAWLLRDAAGALITRNGGDDVALDVGNAGFRRASADFLVAKCATERWTGVQHDEVNSHFGWGWNGAVPARYPTDAAWQQALLGYVTYLAQRLAQRGFTLGGNLGVAPGGTENWYLALLQAGLIPSIEYFVCGEHNPRAIKDSYADPATWERHVAYVEAVEAFRGGSPRPVSAAGTRILVHDRQQVEAGIRYSLGSYLLATSGTGAGVYGADVGYSADDTPYPACFTDALRLGAPLGPRTKVAADVWARRFTGGLVLVNTGRSAQGALGFLVDDRDALIVAL